MTTPLGTRGGRAQHIPLPLGKLHRHVVPGMQYDAYVVLRTWYLLVPWQACIFFVVLSFRYRFIAIVTDIIPTECRYCITYRIVFKR